MQVADNTTTNTSHISSSPFAAEMSQYIQTQNSIDERNQSRIIKWSSENETEPDSTPVELKSKGSKPNSASQRNTAYNHQNNPIVIAMKKWYQIRGWSLLYPLLASGYLVISELDFNIRMIGYIFMTFSCVRCYINMKNFESQKNLKCILLVILCILVALGDFLFQYSFIGNKGWAATGRYQICFNFTGALHNKEVHDRLCSIFKALYYLDSLTYLGMLVSFGVYLLATSKLVKLVSGSENNQRVRFEDEVEIEN